MVSGTEQHEHHSKHLFLLLLITRMKGFEQHKWEWFIIILFL